MPGGTSGTFGMMPGNNAPLPPSTSLNTTGTQASGWGFGGSNFPNYPIFGPSNFGVPSPSANLPLFGTGGSTSSGLNSGIASLFNDPLANYYNDPAFWNQVGKTYGKGTGIALQEILGQMFNPSTAEAFINAMQPQVARGQASILNAFGAEGSRFGSAAALGLGDFQSQVNLNESQVLAQMWMQAQQEQLQLIEGMMPALHAEKANSGGWLHGLLSGLENVTGVGALLGALNSGTGVNTADRGLNVLQPSYMPGSGPTMSAPFNPTSGMPSGSFMPLEQILGSSAGSTLGGSSGISDLLMAFGG